MPLTTRRAVSPEEGKDDCSLYVGYVLLLCCPFDKISGDVIVLVVELFATSFWGTILWYNKIKSDQWNNI